MLLMGWSCGHCTVGPFNLEGRAYFGMIVRSVEEDLIPYVVQLAYNNVLVEGWIIDTNEHGLFDGPSNGM